jgi:hypothetical protein
VRLGRHEQLEEELAVVLVQPVGEPLEAPELAVVDLPVALGVQAHEHLREVGVEALDVLAEGVAVLEVELVLAALLDRHRELEALLLRPLGDPVAELLVDEHAGRRGVEPALHRQLHALEDQLLGVRDRRRLLLRRVALDPEHLLLEGATVIEGQDVQLAVVAERHLRHHLCSA